MASGPDMCTSSYENTEVKQLGLVSTWMGDHLGAPGALVAWVLLHRGKLGSVKSTPPPTGICIVSVSITVGASLISTVKNS